MHRTYGEVGDEPIVEDVLLDADGRPCGKGSSGREVVSNVNDKSSPCSVIEDTEDSVDCAASASSWRLSDRLNDSSRRSSKYERLPSSCMLSVSSEDSMDVGESRKGVRKSELSKPLPCNFPEIVERVSSVLAKEVTPLQCEQ